MSHSKQKYSQSLKQSDQQMQHMRGFFGSSSKLTSLWSSDFALVHFSFIKCCVIFPLKTRFDADHRLFAKLRTGMMIIWSFFAGSA